MKREGRAAAAARLAQISAILCERYPVAECALQYGGDPWRLLIMGRLSAQCTDARVNEVSLRLFAAYPTAAAMAEADEEAVAAIIRPCGLFRSKADQILKLSEILVRDYNGEVPREKKALLALPGVGEKIANLMMGDVFGDPHIVADTHCIRLAGRFSLTKSALPSRVTKDLEALIPKAEQSDFCHRLIQLGREYCKAQNPRCESCPLAEYSE
jgi:endonuclease-3